MNTRLRPMDGRSNSGETGAPSWNTFRIVLIGGGHSHVQFLKSWRMNPLPGVEVVLVSKEPWTPYSGMLPSRLAGWYDDAQMHFDLLNLCTQCGVAFLEDEVVKLEPERARVILKNRPPLAYDAASLNIGVTPELPPGAANHPRVLAVKPISALIPKWKEIWSGEHRDMHVAIVGAGASGFELSVICAERLRARGGAGQVTLFEAGADVLPGHSLAVRRKARAILRARGVGLKLNHSLREISASHLIFSSGEKQEFAQAILTTGAKAPEWMRESGLPVDAKGFVSVDRELRVKGYANLFAAGDCADFSHSPLPKSGVYAVREGPTLIENLRRVANGRKKLRAYRPQRRTLSLLTSGDRRALLSYGPLAWESSILWKLKSRIDMGFMERFGAAAAKPMTGEGNTCGGCGGKVSAEDLRELVSELKSKRGLAALLPPGIEDVGVAGDQVTSIDGFRAFTRDWFFFGQVAAWHSLNDLYASGAKPQNVNVYVGLEEARPRLRRNALLQLMSGVMSVLEQTGVTLSNAHTAVAAETSLALSVSGPRPAALWSKGGLQEGDVLIMTKSLGTGVLLQALMNGGLPLKSKSALRDSLLLPHDRVLNIAAGFSVHAATDISGFGLVGHLWEMAEASRASLEIDASALTFIEGAVQTAERGFSSHLADENRTAFARHAKGDLSNGILFDPQTHGPLILSVPAAEAERFVQALRSGGYPQVKPIGRVARINTAELNFSERIPGG